MTTSVLTNACFVSARHALQVSLWHIFTPFENRVWVAVFVAMFVVFVLLWVFDRANMERADDLKLPQVQCIRGGHVIKGQL